MTSQIDVTKPIFGTPTTQSVRDNFTTAANEISLLQQQTVGSPFLPLAGGRLTGPVYLHNDPTDAMMPATKGYVDAGGGGDGGGSGIPEAPPDGQTYGRSGGAWDAVLPLAGGALLGALILAGDPTAALGAVTKRYADAIAATVIADAPNDANTYGRHQDAWVGVLPIAGGQLTGSLGVARPVPATAQVGSLLAVSVSASSHLINAYNDASGTLHYRAAGVAIGFGQFNNNLALYIAPAGVADAAFTFPTPTQIDPLGNMILPGATAIPSDALLPWLSAVEFVSTGHYAFNSYIPTPGTSWKYLKAGYAAQFYQNSTTDGTVVLAISQSSGAAGGVLGPAFGFSFAPNGNFNMSGILSAGPAIMALASGGNAFVGSYQTGGSPAVLGFYSLGNILYFGNADGNGVPTVSRGFIDSARNWVAGGGVFANGATNQFGFYNNGASFNVYQFQQSWYLGWNTSSGDLSFQTPSGGLINTRLSPDFLVWNALGPMGGNGPYVNISDDRAKEDIAPATVGLAEILRTGADQFHPDHASGAGRHDDGGRFAGP